MGVRKLRSAVAGLALAASAFAWGTVLLRVPSQAQATGKASVQITQEQEFLLAEREGKVCIFAGDTLLSNTGIPVRSLPRQDREELQRGITARGEQELAALLEDLGA